MIETNYIMHLYLIKKLQFPCVLTIFKTLKGSNIFIVIHQYLNIFLLPILNLFLTLFLIKNLNILSLYFMTRLLSYHLSMLTN